MYISYKDKGYIYADILQYISKKFNINARGFSQMEHNDLYHRVLHGIQTTTNNCEAYHKTLNANVCKKFRDLSHCIQFFKLEAEKADLFYVDYFLQRKTVTKYTERRDAIKQILERYDLLRPVDVMESIYRIHSFEFDSIINDFEE